MNEEEIQKAVEAKFKELQDKFEKVQADYETLKSNNAEKAELEKAITSIETVGKTLENFIEEQKTKTVDSVLKQFTDFVVENQEKLKSIQAAGTGVIEFVPKAVGSITTGSGTNIGTEPNNMHTNLGSFNLRNDNALMDLMTVTSQNSAALSYTDLIPKEGDYTFVAEGAKKPEIDFKWETRFAEPKKIAAYEILTEEAVTDIARLQSVAREYLTKKHDLFKVNALYFAAGTGTLPRGATVYGRTFVAGQLALRIKDPNFMDVVNAVITDVYTTHNYIDEMEYMPNLVLINPVDFFVEFQAAKDANGLPLYPQASLFNSVTIGGVTIRPWGKIPAGKIFVADMKKYNVVNYVPFSIRLGFINEQFIHNMFTMLGESRFFQYVKNLDRQAFVYDDIATIKTAIATPVVTP